MKWIVFVPWPAVSDPFSMVHVKTSEPATGTLATRPESSVTAPAGPVTGGAGGLQSIVTSLTPETWQPELTDDDGQVRLARVADSERITDRVPCPPSIVPLRIDHS